MNVVFDGHHGGLITHELVGSTIKKMNSLENKIWFGGTKYNLVAKPLLEQELPRKPREKAETSKKSIDRVDV